MNYQKNQSVRYITQEAEYRNKSDKCDILEINLILKYFLMINLISNRCNVVTSKNTLFIWHVLWNLWAKIVIGYIIQKYFYITVAFANHIFLQTRNLTILKAVIYVYCEKSYGILSYFFLDSECYLRRKNGNIFSTLIRLQARHYLTQVSKHLFSNRLSRLYATLSRNINKPISTILPRWSRGFSRGFASTVTTMVKFKSWRK